jgi:hypothetical protein
VEDSALFMTTASLHLGAAAETATLIDMVFAVLRDGFIAVVRGRPRN